MHRGRGPAGLANLTEQSNAPLCGHADVLDCGGKGDGDRCARPDADPARYGAKWVGVAEWVGIDTEFLPAIAPSGSEFGNEALTVEAPHEVHELIEQVIGEMAAGGTDIAIEPPNALRIKPDLWLRLPRESYDVQGVTAAKPCGVNKLRIRPLSHDYSIGGLQCALRLTPTN